MSSFTVALSEERTLFLLKVHLIICEPIFKEQAVEIVHGRSSYCEVCATLLGAD